MSILKFATESVTAWAASNGLKGLVPPKDGDVDGRWDGVGMIEDGGGIICHYKGVVWGVPTSDVMVWLYW